MLPQMLLIVLLTLGLGVSLAKHGEPRDPHSFWTTLISSAILAGLLHWGGFFAPLFEG